MIRCMKCGIEDKIKIDMTWRSVAGVLLAAASSGARIQSLE